jgi:hypothetical protein
MALTQTDLDAINTAIASGELTVRSTNGSQVTYRSMDELIKARDLAKADIAAAQPTARAYPRHQLADFSDD